MINMHTKFKVSSLSRSRDILRGLTVYNGLRTWRGNAHLRDILSSVGWDMLCSTHILTLKRLRLPATKKLRAMPNVKIFVLSHPLGDLGVMYTVHPWLVGKRVVDFLLALIELFPLALTVEALWANIGQNGAVWNWVGHFKRKFQGGRGSPINKFCRQKTRFPALSHGVVCVIVVGN